MGIGNVKSQKTFFGNVIGHAEGVTDSGALWSWIAEQFDASFSWDDLDWLRNQWQGKIILKGILDADDAEIAAKLGYDGIVVSNHGGRQLDGAPSSISALPTVIDKVGNKTIREIPASLSEFRKSKPLYKELEGWGDLTPDMIEKGFNALPQTLQDYVKYIEDQVDCKITIISMGPQRHETIIR